MQPYKFSFQYEPVHTNASDVLSRSPLLATGKQLSDDAEHFINSIVYDAIPESVTLEEIQEMSRNDEILKNVKEQISTKNGQKSQTTNHFS